MDRRLTPANGRVALRGLEGQVTAERFVDGVWRRVAAPLTDLCATPAGRRDRQLLSGARVRVLEERGGWAFLQAEADGYVGWVATVDLGSDIAPTHKVKAPATLAFRAAELKSPECASLSLGAQVFVGRFENGFAATALGHIPTQHVCPVDEVEADIVAVAERFLGTPYLWGGNSRAGIDCSGLVQAALWAVGMACPGDSDLQARLGAEIPVDEGLRRGDLLFWKGHVAIVRDQTTMIHANAGHMSVAIEVIDDGIARIAAQGDGPVTARRRVSLLRE